LAPAYGVVSVLALEYPRLPSIGARPPMTAIVDPLPDDLALAYVDRLGLELTPGSVDVEALHRLQRAHLERVPFETIDIVRGQPPGIDPVASAGRIVEGQGGYCYHLNGAFSALLAWLGLDVTRHLAGVYGGTVAEPSGPSGNHLGLTVDGLDRETLLVDVGLGDGPAEPLRLVVGEHDQHGFRYLLEPSPFGDGVWRFRHEPGGGFRGFDVATTAAATEDFVAMHRFLSTQTTFATLVTVQRRSGARLEILRGRVYTERTADGSRRTEVGSAAEWWELVLDHFGLAYDDLSAAERSALWEHVRAEHDAWRASGRE
jgi:arylamine N-acetyltransferase